MKPCVWFKRIVDACIFFQCSVKDQLKGSMGGASFAFIVRNFIVVLLHKSQKKQDTSLHLSIWFKMCWCWVQSSSYYLYFISAAFSAYKKPLLNSSDCDYVTVLFLSIGIVLKKISNSFTYCALIQCGEECYACKPAFFKGKYTEALPLCILISGDK